MAPVAPLATPLAGFDNEKDTILRSSLLFNMMNKSRCEEQKGRRNIENMEVSGDSQRRWSQEEVAAWDSRACAQSPTCLFHT